MCGLCLFTQAKSVTPASIRGLSEITNPNPGLKPREARLPSHNKISPVAESKGQRGRGGEGWKETAKRKKMMRPLEERVRERVEEKKNQIRREMKLGSPALLFSFFFRQT